jgi:hypothetical protein
MRNAGARALGSHVSLSTPTRCTHRGHLPRHLRTAILFTSCDASWPVHRRPPLVPHPAPTSPPTRDAPSVYRALHHLQSAARARLTACQRASRLVNIMSHDNALMRAQDGRERLPRCGRVDSPRLCRCGRCDLRLRFIAKTSSRSCATYEHRDRRPGTGNIRRRDQGWRGSINDEQPLV